MNGGTMDLHRIARITTKRGACDGFEWITVTFVTADGSWFAIDAHPASGQPLPVVEHRE